MARRARSSTNPAWFIIVILLLAGMGAGMFFFSQLSDPYRTIEELPVDAYLENSGSLRGNIYRVEGTVENQLAWTPDNGRLYSITVSKTNDLLPLLIPASFNATNFQKGQRFTFEIEVGDRGILLARNFKKV